MKIRYGDYQLSDGAIEGASGLTLNGQQINDRFDLVRALSAIFVPKGNRSAVLSFSVNRQKDTLHASERFVLEHFWQLPEQADLMLYLGTDADGSWCKFTGAVIDAAGTGYRGVSPMVQYSFSVGGPPAFDQSPPGTPDPDDDMKRGLTAISSAAETVAVVFAAPFSGTPIVTATVQIPDGGDYLTCQILDTTVSSTGFTARLSGPTPGTGYKLSWMAIL